MTAPHDTVQEAGWGPDVEERGSRSRLVRAVLIALIVLLVLLLALPMLISTQIPRTPVEGLASGGSPTNVLIAGSDSREGLTEDEMRELSTGFDDDSGERTDTILVMSFQGSDVALLSFPRDLWVERCDGSTGRINVAQALDGPSCLVDTVQQVSGLDIHHYARVTFGGFRDVVDAVGGVEMCLEEPISDRDAGIDLPAGCQRLDGADSLGFVRVRKIDDDLARIERQQQFMRALAREVSQPSTLLNPVRFYRTANDAGRAVMLDDGAGPIALARIGWAGRGLAAGDVATHTVPGDPDTTSGGAAILRIRESEAEALFARFRDGSILGSEDAQVQPAEIPVSVLNGTEVSGFAGQVGDLLEGRGYPIRDVANADPRERSLIRHPPGQREAARRLARDVPGQPEIEETSDVTVVTVILGADAAGAA